jgi:Ca2+/Na+ antiporter
MKIKNLFKIFNSDVLFSIVFILVGFSLIMLFVEGLWQFGWKIAAVSFVVAVILWFLALHKMDKEHDELWHRRF